LECGDPGIQYDDNINAWNPFLAMGLRFNSSNACSEVQYLDNSACNLASLRITAYYDSQKNTFNSINLYEDISIMLMAQDILIDFSYYPTEDIAKTSYNTRNLGLNYGDLGGLLYMMGLPYDSDEARCVAAVITSYFTACAHTASMDMALTLGSFKYLEEDIGDLKHHMKSILSNHYSMHGCLFDKPQNIDLVNSCDNTSFNAYKAITNIIMDNKNIPSFIRDMQTSSVNKYEYILNSDEADFKLRNATVTVFVPQGTVGLTLGNLTSGIEPFLSHSFGKDLVGGGNMRFITGDDIHHIARVNCNRIYGDSYEMINRLNETAIGTDGKGILSPMAHIMMMAAVQPFISLAISKTVNCPSDITVDQIVQLYKDAHKYGLKAVTIYVDGSKVLQPLRTEKKIVSDNVNRNESGNNIVGVTGGLGSLCDPRDVDLRDGLFKLVERSFMLNLVGILMCMICFGKYGRSSLFVVGRLMVWQKL
jgi:ribonucleoside-diphosphate reductase alpha chain